MPLVLTILAVVIGVALGVKWGGQAANLLAWRPVLWEALLGGVVLTMLVDVLPWSGWFTVLLSIAAMGALLTFAVLNIRVGGMVLVVAGIGLNLFVTIFNWGTPVSAWALEAAGVVDDASAAGLTLTGGRHVGGFLVIFGDAIPLPWGQVISIGDVIAYVGLALVVASVVRRYEVGGGFGSMSSGPGYRSRSGIGYGGPRDYRDALDALGRGPAPRRGPGLHPSRLDTRSGGRRRRSSRSTNR